jgi:D-methionine transport system ATP-binding protein
MIELINVSKTFYGHKVLDHINLKVAPGEVFGIIGPSGAGKSTLVRCVNMLERPSEGTVIVAGKNLTQMNDRQLREERKHIGMIFQHFNLLSSRTVYDNIALPLKISGFSHKQIDKEVQPLLELTGLTEKKKFYPNQLSGGQKQRVAIARALANKPRVLLSDEATSALDPQTTHSILQLLKDINENLGLTILLITHEMDVVKEICHHLAILEAGSIIEQAEVLEFFSRPKTKIAKQFIRSSLQHKLPDVIQARLSREKVPNSDTLLRLSFVGSVAQEPLIAHLVQNYQVDINILQANIEVIRDEIIGVMLIQANCDDSTLKKSIDFLEGKGIYVEVIGYYVR